MSAVKGAKPWNAGTSHGWVDKRGYRWVYITENGRRRARLEHRVIMERTVGRRLEPWEDVHHKNEIKTDNRPENLEVVNHTAHTLLTHNGKKRPEDFKKAMETFARLREEINHLRRVNTDLLKVLKVLREAATESYKNGRVDALAFVTAGNTIAKAEGR